MLRLLFAKHCYDKIITFVCCFGGKAQGFLKLKLVTHRIMSDLIKILIGSSHYSISLMSTSNQLSIVQSFYHNTTCYCFQVHSMPCSSYIITVYNTHSERKEKMLV